MPDARCASGTTTGYCLAMMSHNRTLALIRPRIATVGMILHVPVCSLLQKAACSGGCFIAESGASSAVAGPQHFWSGHLQVSSSRRFPSADMVKPFVINYRRSMYKGSLHPSNCFATLETVLLCINGKKGLV